MRGIFFEHYLSGDIVDIAGFGEYSTIGAVAYWYTEDKPGRVERFLIELSSVNSGRFALLSIFSIDPSHMTVVFNQFVIYDHIIDYLTAS